MFDRDEFVDAAARAMWVSSWASAAEEQGESFGGDLMDVAPPTPDEAIEAAEVFATRLARVNEVDIDRLWVRAAHAPGKHYREPTVEDFGHYLAMASLGHGVSWFDDHPPFLLEIPHSEFYVGPDYEVDFYTGM